jgi:hypothetical protein
MVLKANSLTTGICAHLKTISHEEINVWEACSHAHLWLHVTKNMKVINTWLKI